MPDMESIIFIVGNHDTGKTTVMETLLDYLKDKAFKIATIKDIKHSGFMLDEQGKDTWRHAKAGASIVCASAIHETDFLVKYHLEFEKIKELVLPHADIILVEGFKEIRGKKIIVARTLNDITQIQGLITEDDEILAVAGPVVDDGLYSGDATTMERGKVPHSLQELLIKLGKQGQLRRNRVEMPLASYSCSLDVNGCNIPLKPYVSTTLKNIAIATIAPLTWNLKNPLNHVRISFQVNESMVKGESFKMQVNQKSLGLKSFVVDSISSVILGYISTLDLESTLMDQDMQDVLIKIDSNSRDGDGKTKSLK